MFNGFFDRMYSAQALPLQQFEGRELCQCQAPCVLISNALTTDSAFMRLNLIYEAQKLQLLKIIQ